MKQNLFEFDAIIQKVLDQDGAYIVFPYDVRAKIGKQPDDSVRVTVRERT